MIGRVFRARNRVGVFRTNAGAMRLSTAASLSQADNNMQGVRNMLYESHHRRGNLSNDVECIRN